MSDSSSGESTFVEWSGRIAVTIAACILLSWQLVETVSFERNSASRWRVGTPLQWYLLALMLLSLFEGIIIAVIDARLLAQSGALDVETFQETVSVDVAGGRTDQAIVSLMIIGLGVSGWLQGMAYASVAMALGTAALAVRWLPAPLVLVCGVSCLQRKPAKSASTAAPEQDGRRRSICCCCCTGSCCNLRCALRPLLVLALLETFYAALRPGDEAVEELVRKAKQDATVMAASTHDEVIEQQLLVLDSIKPAQLLEMVQQQLGQMVMLGVVTALGVSSRTHGLRYGLLPVFAAFVPGVPISFAIVFYFLLETRSLQAGGTLLPLHADAQPSSPCPR